jgi:VCBS repeat-containing protein
LPAINLQSFSLPENSPNGTVVATVQASDPDAGQTLSYSIVAGNTGGAFAINPATGEVTVANSAALNFEVTRTFVLTVQVIDNGNPPLSNLATVTINLNNVNEAPVNTVPGAQIAQEDTPLVFSPANGNLIFINDVDSGSNPVQVTLAVLHGTLRQDRVVHAYEPPDSTTRTQEGVPACELQPGGRRQIGFAYGLGVVPKRKTSSK